MPHLQLRAVALAMGVLLIFAASAQAATVTNVTAAPVDKAAGAHSDFTVSFDIGGLGDVSSGDDVKNVQLDLPPGLIGNPQATAGTCSHAQFMADSCDPKTKVGTTTVLAAVAPGGIPAPGGDQTIPGDLYNIDPQPGDAARLGIVLRPTLMGLPQPKQFLESPAVLRATDGGLRSVVANIPRTADTTLGAADLRIDRQSLTLQGKTSKGSAFETNPTSCGPATTTVTIGTYDGATASGQGSFTPTGCAALPFAPRLASTIGANRNDVRAGQHPQVVVTVSQQPGEANARTVQVALPSGLGAYGASLPNACPLATYQAGACPANAVVGSAVADSPLLAGPLTGPVTYVAPGDGLPQLRVALRGSIGIDLTGVITFAGTRLVNTFDGIADVPLNRFVLTVNAGPNSPVVVSRDLCTPGRGRLDGTFTAHSGKVATATTQAVLPGCANVRAPRVSGRIGRLHRGRPALRLRAASPDRPISSLRVRLPKGLSFSARAKRLVQTGLAGSRVKVRGRALTVTLPTGGDITANVLLRPGAVKVSKALRRARRPHPRLSVEVRRIGLAVKRVTVKPKVVAKP